MYPLNPLAGPDTATRLLFPGRHTAPSVKAPVKQGLHTSPVAELPITLGSTLIFNDLSDRDLLQVVSGNMGECSAEARFLRTLMGIVTEGGGADPQVQQRTGTNFLVTREQEVAKGNLMGNPDAVLTVAIPDYDPANPLHSAIRCKLVKRQEDGALLGARFRDLVRIPTIWDLNAHGKGDMKALLREAIINSTRDSQGTPIPGARYSAKFFSSQNWLDDIKIALALSKELREEFGDAFQIELAISFSEQPHYPAKGYIELFKQYVVMANEKGLSECTTVSFKDMVGSATPGFLIEQVVTPCLEWLKGEGISIGGLAHHMHETDNREEIAARRAEGLLPRATEASVQFVLVVEKSELLGDLVKTVQIDGINGGEGVGFPNFNEYIEIFKSHGHDLDLSESDASILAAIHQLGAQHIDFIDPAIAPIISVIEGKDLRELDVPGGAISSTVMALSAVKAKLVEMSDTLGAGVNHNVPMEFLSTISELKQSAGLSDDERDLEISKVALKFFFGEMKELQKDFGYPWKVTPGYQHCMILGISRCMDKLSGNPTYTTLPDGTAQFFASGPFPGPIRPDLLARCCTVRIRNNAANVTQGLDEQTRKAVLAIAFEHPVDKEACETALRSANLGLDETQMTTILSLIGPGKGQYEGTKDSVATILDPLRDKLNELHASELTQTLQDLGIENPYRFIEAFGVNVAGAEAHLLALEISEGKIPPVIAHIQSAYDDCFPKGTPPLMDTVFSIQSHRKYALEFTLAQAVSSSIVGSGWDDALKRPRTHFPSIWAPSPDKFAVPGGDKEEKAAAKLAFRNALIRAEAKRTGADANGDAMEKPVTMNLAVLSNGPNQMGEFGWVGLAETEDISAKIAAEFVRAQTRMSAQLTRAQGRIIGQRVALSPRREYRTPVRRVARPVSNALSRLAPNVIRFISIVRKL